MSRYIDADALLKSAVSKFKCVPSVGVIYCRNGEEIFDGEDLQDFIRAMPTADVVEVVRCKDCKHNVSEVCRHDLAMNHIWDGAYCAYGERKEL